MECGAMFTITPPALSTGHLLLGPSRCTIKLLSNEKRPVSLHHRQLQKQSNFACFRCNNNVNTIPVASPESFSYDARTFRSGLHVVSNTVSDIDTAGHAADTCQKRGLACEELTYEDAGVDIDENPEFVKRISKEWHLGRLFLLGDNYFVAGTYGVGTKPKLAFESGIHETIGIDLVAMSVNDIVTTGAKPVVFFDYFATSRLDVDIAEKVIKGIVDGCQQSACVRLGETVETPDFCAEGEYDLCGHAEGIVKQESVIDGKNIAIGDVIIGLPSSGVHTNGFSLVKRVLEQSGHSLKDKLPGSSVTLGEALMTPTVIYVKQVLDIISKGGVKGIAHITGGGLTHNIPLVFPKGSGALIYENSWVAPPVFKWIQEAGRLEDDEMRRTFNMGIGMVLVVDQEAARRILREENGASLAYRIGEVISGDGVCYSK